MVDFADDIAAAPALTGLTGVLTTDMTAFTRDTTTADPRLNGSGPSGVSLVDWQSGWVKLVTAKPSVIELDTHGTSWDTQMAIYSGVIGSLAEIWANDDDPVPNDGTSKITAIVPIGTFYIEVCAASAATAGVVNFSYTITDAPVITITDGDGNKRIIDAIWVDSTIVIADNTSPLGAVRERVAVVVDPTTVAIPTFDGSLPVDPTNGTAYPLLASAVRTATTDSNNVGKAGLYFPASQRPGAQFCLKVTANPGGAETLSVKLQAYAQIVGGGGGDFVDWVDWGVIVTAANGDFFMLTYPGAIAADAAAGVKVKGLPTPFNFRIVVTHSSTGSWTYSLNYVPLA